MYVYTIYIYESIPKVCKLDNLKFGELTANIYNKTTGIKAANEKIKKSVVTFKHNISSADNLKVYYESIKPGDQQMAIATNITIWGNFKYRRLFQMEGK